MPPLDDTDKAILNRIQSDFPMTQRPYAVIGADLGLSESEVIRRTRTLRETGVIRRIGGNFSPEKLGFVSTLCAAKVPEPEIDQFTLTVNRFPGVTHNYQRNNRYNIWFTFIAPSMDEIRANLDAISEETGIKEIISLPAARVYKIKAHFDL